MDSTAWHHDWPLPSHLSTPDMTIGSDDLGDDTHFLSALASLEWSAPGGSQSTGMEQSHASFPELQETSFATRRAAENSPAPKPAKKKRSSIACKACHDKRVRCDRAAQGPPCSNCRFREVECVFIDSKRSRYVHCALLFEHGLPI